MSEQLRESMSAAMDNEADAFELRRVLDEASVDSNLREKWHRLHLMRDILREEVKTYDPGLREAVWQGLLNDPHGVEDDDEFLTVAPEHHANKGASPWLGRITGIAVAVTAAVLVVFNGGVFDDEGSSLDVAGGEPFVTPGQTINLERGDGELAPVMYQQATDADLHRQYGFMLRHIQQRAMNQNGLTSFVKMATFRQPGQVNPVPNRPVPDIPVPDINVPNTHAPDQSAPQSE